MALLKRLNNNRPIGVYYESYYQFNLANIQQPINIVFLSFAKPDCVYTKGSNTFGGTGLSFGVSFSEVKKAIATVKSRGIIVMLSVGGATYKNWDGFKYKAISDLASDLDVDGVDIDWEPDTNTVSDKLGGIIQSMKDAAPNKLISIAGYSTGAYIGQYADRKPSGSPYKGANAPAIKTKGHLLDFINIMSYDANEYETAFNPLDSFNAYRDIYKGPLLLGFQPPPEGWGSGKITHALVNKYTNAIVSDNNSGVFVWAYNKGSLPSYPTTKDIINIADNIFKNKPAQNLPEQPLQPQGPKPQLEGCANYMTIKSGDTCDMIVDKYKIGNLNELYNLNPGLNYAKCSELQIGQQLCVGKGNQPLPKPPQQEQPQGSKPQPEGCDNYMTIKEGDTCDMIVDKYKVGNLEQLYNLNPGLNYAKCSDLQIGQQLCVGKGKQQPQPVISYTTTTYAPVKPQQQPLVIGGGLKNRLGNNRPIGVYYESWGGYKLGEVSAPINIVVLSFAYPDCKYTKGSNTFEGTGLEFSNKVSDVKNTIMQLHTKGIIVMLGVGGATFVNWDGVNYKALSDLASDLGVDGIDIDWEPADNRRNPNDLSGIIKKMREIFPNGLISLAGYGAGAYTTNVNDLRGINSVGIKSDGDKLDFINIMSYDSGDYETSYKPIDSFNAYRAIYKGPLLLGFQSPPEGWGSGKITLDLVKKYTTVIAQDPNAGAFMWSYKNDDKKAPSRPDIINTVNSIFNNSPVLPIQQKPSSAITQVMSTTIQPSSIITPVMSSTITPETSTTITPVTSTTITPVTSIPILTSTTTSIPISFEFDFIEWIKSRQEYMIGAIVILIVIVLLSSVSSFLLLKK